MDGVEVVAEAGDGTEAVALAETVRPEVVLMDIAMAGMNGLEATREIARKFPGSRVVVLSMHASQDFVSQAMKAGAAGYVLKDAAPSELEVAVRAVASGEMYLSPAVSQHLADCIRRRGGGQSSVDQLTPRQREILQLIAEGRSTKEIAKQLALGVKTIETHRAQLMGRLNIHNVAGLVRFAIRAGLVPSEP